MTTFDLSKLLTLLLTGSLLACFGGAETDDDEDDAAPLTCPEATAEEVSYLFDLDASCTTDSDCKVIVTSCDCPTYVNTSSKNDDYIKARDQVKSLCDDAYFQSCEEVECANADTNAVCTQGTCRPAQSN